MYFWKTEILYVWKTETVVGLHKENFCMFAKQRILFFCDKKFSPNPSYLHSGEFVLPWDATNRSSHIQIIHIEILRAQMYLKSAETEGTPPSEHMDIFAKNRLWAPRGVWEAQCVKTIVFFSVKVA